MTKGQPEGIQVQGGSVRAEIHRYRLAPPALLALANPGNIPQDVVIRDENGDELYRVSMRALRLLPDRAGVRARPAPAARPRP
jgi:hypothetical protein